MKRLSLALLIIVASLFSGCAEVQVSQDFTGGYDFNRLRTYNWHPQPIVYGEDDRENSPLLHNRFVAVINGVLMEKGYRSSTTPDFFVTYSYSVTTRIESYPYTTYYGYGYGPHRYYGGYGFSTGPDIRQYDVGTLVIDIFDAQADAVIWRGKGTTIVPSHSTPERTSQRVNTLVRDILSQFPPL